MRDRGLLARFLFALPQSPVGGRKLEPAAMPHHIVTRYEDLLTRILDWQPQEAVTLKLASSAYREWKEFQRAVEVQMADGARLCRIRDWGSKLPGIALRLAGLLHVFRHAQELSVLSAEIQECEIQIALDICATLTSHAIAIFGMVSEDPILRTSKRIMRWMSDQCGRSKEEITKRDCFRAHYPHVFDKVDEMEPCLRILFDHYLIRITKSQNSRSQEVIRTNPRLKEIE